jgi:hypothetical protein
MTMPKRDDLGVLHRRMSLTDDHGVLFEHVRPEGMAPYPLQWTATWTDDAGEHKSGPMPMPDLVPSVEAEVAP